MQAKKPGDQPQGPVPIGSSQGRWVVAASVLGSGTAFLEMTVVNVAITTLAVVLDLVWKRVRPSEPTAAKPLASPTSTS